MNNNNVENAAFCSFAENLSKLGHPTTVIFLILSVLSTFVFFIYCLLDLEAVYMANSQVSFDFKKFF